MLMIFRMMIAAAILSIVTIPMNSPIPLDRIDGKGFADIDCLYKAIHGEAGNQPFNGKVAVAHVILNRVKSDKFPSNNICGIIKQRGQFSFLWHHRKININLISERKQLNDSYIAAVLVLDGKTQDPTNGSLYYVNPKLATHTAWLTRLKKVLSIGDHAFYTHYKK